MGTPVDILKNSPFDDFLIPGIILFFLIGLIEVVLAITLMFKQKLYPTNIVMDFYNNMRKGL